MQQHLVSATCKHWVMTESCCFFANSVSSSVKCKIWGYLPSYLFESRLGGYVCEMFGKLSDRQLMLTVIGGNTYSWGNIPRDRIPGIWAGWAMKHVQAWAMGLVSPAGSQGVLFRPAEAQWNIPGWGSVPREFWGTHKERRVASRMCDLSALPGPVLLCSHWGIIPCFLL